MPPLAYKPPSHFSTIIPPWFFAEFICSHPFVANAMVTTTGEGSTTATAAKLQEVVTCKAMRDTEAKVDDKLSTMKWEMESVDDWLNKKIRLDSKPTFRSGATRNSIISLGQS